MAPRPPRRGRPASLHATYDAGILDITIPLPEEPKTKVKVEVATPKQLQS